MAVEISMKEHEDWMQRRNNERFEKLKAECCKNKKHAQTDLDQPTHPTIMDPALNKAIEKDDVNDFIGKLEQVSEGLCLCTIFDHQVSSSGNSLLHEAAKFGSIEIFKLITNHFPHLLTKQNFKGDTILHVALKAKKIDIIKALTDTFRFMEQKHGGSSEGSSPAYDHKKSFQMKNHIGNTALHEAVRTGHSNEVINYLLWVNPKALYSSNNKGQSPFFLAVETDNKDICQLLLQAAKWNGDLVGMPREKLSVYVYVAILRQRKDILEEIFNEKRELFNIRDKEGNTPLHFAVSTCYFEGTQFLLEKFRQSFLERSTEGDLPIHIACKKGHVEIFKMLLKQHLQEEPRNDLTECINAQGQNILHVAAMSGRNSVVKYILGPKNLNLPIFLNSEDKDGNTALHLASRNLHPDVIVSLTGKKGVDVNLRNNEGLNAVEIVENGRSQQSFRKLGTLWALGSAGIPIRVKSITSICSEEHEAIKDSVNLLSVMAVLVATVSFAAALTVPGGFNSSDYGPAGPGMATLADKKMFQLFIICDTIAMSFSIIGALILLWSQLYGMVSATLKYVLHCLIISLLQLSIAFIAAVCLVVSKVHWLTYIVLIVGYLLLGCILIIYGVWFFPFWDIGDPVVQFFVPFILESFYTLDQKQKKSPIANKDKQEESQSANKSPNELALCVGCMNERIERIERRIDGRMKKVEDSKSKEDG